MLVKAHHIALGVAAAAIVAIAPWALDHVPASLFTEATAVGESARGAAPDRLGSIPAQAWLNTAEDPTPESLRGSVVLMEFWTYLCYNCKNVEGWMKSMYERYGGRGLRVLGVHTPEFAVERRVENVRRYLGENGIGWPVAIDNEYAVWRKYNATNAWPAFLVFDRSGRLVYRAAGESAVHEAERAIERSLEASAPGPSLEEAGGHAVEVRTSVTRRAADRAVLTVELAARPGVRLIRRPANVLWIEPAAGVTGPDDRVLLGEPADPSDVTEVAYFDGPASTRVPLGLSGPGPFTIRGRLIYRFCDEAVKICKSRERSFAVKVPRS